jgi:hypothetical protein
VNSARRTPNKARYDAGARYPKRVRLDAYSTRQFPVICDMLSPDRVFAVRVENRLRLKQRVKSKTKAEETAKVQVEIEEKGVSHE